MDQNERLEAWNAHRPARRGSYAGMSCSIEGCEKPARCRAMCASHYNKALWASGHRAPSVRSEHRLAYRRKWRYGIDGREFERLLLEQDGLCAICRTDGNTGKPKHWVTSLVPDHNHETGKLRGLLCNDCNRIAGRTRDTSILERAIEYVRSRY